MDYGGPVYTLGMKSGLWDGYDDDPAPTKPRAWWDMPYYKEYCEYSENTWKRKLFRYIIHLPILLPLDVLEITLSIILLPIAIVYQPLKSLILYIDKQLTKV